MKKLAVALLAAVLASGAFAQSSFPDIPANHWAGDAVDRIADLGIVIGFPDGTFRGNEAFTRYQAALVVSRLLDVLNENLDAAMALTQADIESLRNAVQEIGSDVAAQGVRLSSAESAIAGLSDEVAANTARLDELEARLSDAGAGVDEAVLRDLQNQIASQRVAIDTAQAQADAAAARADEAYNLANQAANQARLNAEELAALNRVVQLLSGRVDALESRGAGPVVSGDNAALTAAIERNRSDIANLREFVILLRRDQVALRDRVAALEASDAEQSAAIAALEDRVTALEENPLGITGSITVEYFVGRVLGDPFDVDRVYGLNNERTMASGASVFSSGAAELDGDSDTSSNYKTEVGEVAQDRHDIEQTTGNASATVSLSFGAGSTFDGVGSPNALNSFSAVLVIDIDTNNNAVAGDPIVFELDKFTATFSPIGAAPLTFEFGTDVNPKFTPYLVGTSETDTDYPGFVATLSGVGFLDFIDPTVTAFYTAPTNPALDPGTYRRGIRATLSPFEGVTLGGSFAQQSQFADDKDDVNADNEDITVWGVDLNASVSVFTLNFEWANGSSTAPAATNESVLYAELEVDVAGAGLPILSSLNANYRSISDTWRAQGYNLGAAGSGFPFDEDQTGFGVEAGLSLFILDLEAFFDSYSTVATDSVTAFGVDVEADLFAGFSLGGFFHQVSVNGTVVDRVDSLFDANEAAVAIAGTSVERDDSNYQTGFGVSLAHDGAADNALIRGLNLEASYKQLEADFSKSVIEVSADMDLTVSIVTLTPYVSFSMQNDADTDVTSQNKTELKAGAGLVTEALNVYTQPSLMAAVNYRNADYTTNGGGQVYTATELQWSVGLVLNQFIFDNSVLTAKYGSWTGTNISNVTNTRGAGDFATDISAGDVNGTGTQSTSGYEVIWNYFDLEFAYGVYENNNNGVLSSAQAFSIAYTVDLD